MTIAIDLDKTLAEYNEGQDLGTIGKPIPLMMEKVKKWLADGKKLVIFTARANTPSQIPVVEKWLEEQGLTGLKVTNKKTSKSEVFYDDRCIQVVPNTGELALVINIEKSIYQRVRNSKLEIVHDRRVKHEEDIHAHATQLLDEATKTLDKDGMWMKSHLERTGVLAGKIARKMGLGDRVADKVSDSAMLHDIGKLNMSLISSHNKLTPDEILETHKHPLQGAETLEATTDLKHLADGVRQHHEKEDGSGYPNHLSSKDISIEAKIISVADAFDAIVTTRPYHDGDTLPMAIEDLYKNVGTQFDKRAVDALVSVLRDEKKLPMLVVTSKDKVKPSTLPASSKPQLVVAKSDYTRIRNGKLQHVHNRVVPKGKQKEDKSTLTMQEMQICNWFTHQDWYTMNESASLLDKSGTEISGEKIEGTAHEVRLEPEILKKTDTLIHNHPSGTSFSLQDLYTAHMWNMSKIIAVGDSNREYDALFSRYESGTVRQNTIYIASEIGKDLDSEHFLQQLKIYDYNLQFETREKIEKGLLSVADANKNHAHELMTRLAKEGLIKYERIYI